MTLARSRRTAFQEAEPEQPELVPDSERPTLPAISVPPPADPSPTPTPSTFPKEDELRLATKKREQRALSNTRLHVAPHAVIKRTPTPAPFFPPPIAHVDEEPQPDTARTMRPRYASGPRLRPTEAAANAKAPLIFAAFATPDRAFFSTCVDGWEDHGHRSGGAAQHDRHPVIDQAEAELIWMLERRNGLSRWVVAALIVCTVISVAALVGHLGAM